MKALNIRHFGQLSDVRLEDVPLPAPESHEVIVRIKAASVNPLDLKILAGQKQAAFPVNFPYTMGTDFAGVVETTGDGVTGFKHGDRVAGRLSPSAGGAFAEYAAVPADLLSHIPAGVSNEQASALPTAAATAKQALFNVGKLLPGQHVLIHAGAGGVGSFAIQLAKQAGAYVIATASEHKLDLIRELGADVAIDYHNSELLEHLGGMHLVLDTRGGETLARSWATVRPGGSIVSIVDNTIKPRDEIQAVFTAIKHDASVLSDLLKDVEAKRLRVLVDSTHNLDDAHEALERLAAGHSRGKVIICIGS
ncbi:NADP-dependent oxidoreductase [Undibacterium sp. TC4M20W]|uniref:NADP-dependent oxidoreductase n=1 Tax=Undibacterium sp. TC4M20W TaxID=3413052 RepID=UPI003BF397DB